MTRSLYAILNVSPDADPAVIEAAYKVLMKKYHPDALVGKPDSDQKQAAEINRAFQILRDPERRAQYDTQEQARQSAIRMAMPGPELRQMQFQHVQPPKRSKWPALLLIAVLAALTIYVWQMTEGTGREQFASDIPARAAGARDRTLQRGGANAALPPVNEINIDRAIAESRRVNQKMGLMGLSGYSQDCFASQSRSAKLSELDFCVAFDSAASAFDSHSARVYSLPELPRFEAREMMSRHLSAAKTISDDDAWVLDRLAQVRSLTAARLDALQTPPAIATPAAAPALRQRQAVSAQRTPPRTAQRTAQRHAAPRPPRPPEKRRSDRDFLERQGYIY